MAHDTSQPILYEDWTMNNLPLQPLVWQDLDEDPMLAPVSVSESPLHHYVVLKDGEGIKVRYSKKGADFDYATGFATIDEAKAWAWKHYNEKMQPHVKPIPTWIDASEQLPQVDVDTQFICAYDSAIEPYVKVTYFDKILNEFDHEGVLTWMPIPEFSTMQILHKGE